MCKVTASNSTDCHGCLWRRSVAVLSKIFALLSLVSMGRAATASDSPLFWESRATRHPPPAIDLPAVQPDRPRLVFQPAHGEGRGRTFAAVRRLHAEDPVFRDIFQQALQVPRNRLHPAMAAACWIVSEDNAYAEASVRLMLERRIRRSGPPYSNIWSFALAYDWLYHHPAMTAAARTAIEQKIAAALDHELSALDQQSLALWHGRNQVANNAMIAALALGDQPPHDRRLRRAAAHYADSLRALQHSEAWPEGASYWIYNRAGPYAIAADSVMTAFNTDTLNGMSIPAVMRQIGYWSLYQFGPNQVFEPYGDSSGSLQLGRTGWWELTADYFARLSGDPGVMAGADYIRNRSPVPYGPRPYYWHVALSYDPSGRPAGDGYDPHQPELWMREHLPQSMLFGRRSMGLAFFRGAWGDPDETYAAFNAGDYFTHHQHYDVGHFSIQKGGLLAPRTGLVSAGYTSDHRLGYLTQTVSANSLLILAPGETSSYLEWRAQRHNGWVWLSGGQRAIRPTGFVCANFDHFQEQLQSGPHLERASVTAFESVPDTYDYIAADITAAYNSVRFAEPDRPAKLALATRSFLHLRALDAFVVYDRVDTPSPEFLPKFLLHHVRSKPESETERLLSGNGPQDGILETRDRLLVSRHRRGRLEHHIVLPADARALKIGGPNYHGYVEFDGTQAQGFTGRNIGHGDPTEIRAATHAGLWRTEVEPRVAGTKTRFLNVLVARLEGGTPPPSVPVSALAAGPHAHGVRVADWAAVFARRPEPWPELDLRLPAPLRVLAFDAEPGRTYRAASRTATASAEGAVDFGVLPAGHHLVRPD